MLPVQFGRDDLGVVLIGWYWLWEHDTGIVHHNGIGHGLHGQSHTNKHFGLVDDLLSLHNNLEEEISNVIGLIVAHELLPFRWCLPKLDSALSCHDGLSVVVGINRGDISILETFSFHNQLTTREFDCAVLALDGVGTVCDFHFINVKRE